MDQRKKPTNAAGNGAKRPVRYDENGRPIVPKRRPPQNGAKRPAAAKKRVGNEKYERRDQIDFDRHAYAQERANESKRRHEIQKSKKGNRISVALLIVQAVLSVVFFMLVYFLNMLPFRYTLLLVLLLVVFWAFTLVSQRSKKAKTIGKVYAVFMILILFIGSIYVWKAHSVIDEVTSNEPPTTKLSDVSIIVMKNSPANGLEDLAGKRFGIQKIIDRENTDLTLIDLGHKLNETIKTIEYDSLTMQVQALYYGRVDVIILNEVYRPLLQEDFPNFDEETRILDSFTYVREVEEKSTPKRENIQIDTEPFNVYLSGNDEWGKVSLDNGRADVNIIATVNPTTKQILLTTTPRDYYVELPFYSGCMDKLTHAGLYGLDVSMETLENLYGIDIDYYVRINFSGFQNVVDAIGGVTVNSEYEFTSIDGITHFYEGENYLNGYEALLFVRERYAFSSGDIQRGRNQMAMIQAIADKIISPVILTNYMQLMNSVSSCFITDIPSDKISDLVRMQLNDGAEWNIVSNSVIGYVNARTTYSMGNTRLSVVDPDWADVELARELIQAVMNGEIIQAPDKYLGLQISNSYDPNYNDESDSSAPESSKPEESEPPEESSEYDPNEGEESGENSSWEGEDSSYPEESDWLGGGESGGDGSESVPDDSPPDEGSGEGD